MIRFELACFFEAIRFFTRLPLPGWLGYSPAAQGQAARYLPAVGWLVGGIAALVAAAALHVWPLPVAVLLALAAALLATGAFHEDGLSDTADGLGGGWDKARILAIMKDSRVGSYGVVALWLALSGKAVLLCQVDAGLLPWALLAGHALSRGCAVLLLATMDYARDDAQAKVRALTSRLAPGALLVALVFAVLPLLALPFWPALCGVLLALLATVWLAMKFRRWLGGYTGDCLGATQQVAEIAFYLGLLVQWPM